MKKVKNWLKQYLPKQTQWNSRTFAAFYALFLIETVFATFLAYNAGYRLNLTPSLPCGIWKVEKEGKLQKNSYVTVSPNGNPGYGLAFERGYVHKLTTMLKKIVAIEGDCVSYDVGEKAVTVNGEYVFFTEILSLDTEERPLPSASFPALIDKQQAWLSSEFIRGYDSRYFGPVSTDALKKATPIWVFR
jgi:conjugative transfer signal peptidase TraF